MDVRFYPAAAGDPAGLDFAQCLGYYGYSKFGNNNNYMNMAEANNAFFAASEQTFHTPSLGDEEFEIPPITPPPESDPALGMPDVLLPFQGLSDPLPSQGSEFTPQFPPQSLDLPSITISRNLVEQDGVLHSSGLHMDQSHTQVSQYRQDPSVIMRSIVHMTDAARSGIMPPAQLTTINQSQLSAQLGLNLGGASVPHTSPSPPASKSATPSPSSSINEEDADESNRAIGEKRAAPDSGKKPKTPKKKKKKDPNEPQKPVSAYALFFRDTQAAIKGQNPNATFGEVSKIVASMWDSLGEEQKQVYKRKTEAAKKEYLKALAAYRASLVSKHSPVTSQITSPIPALGSPQPASQQHPSQIQSQTQTQVLSQDGFLFLRHNINSKILARRAELSGTENLQDVSLKQYKSQVWIMSKWFFAFFLLFHIVPMTNEAKGLASPPMFPEMQQHPTTDAEDVCVCGEVGHRTRPRNSVVIQTLEQDIGIGPTQLWLFQFLPIPFAVGQSFRLFQLTEVLSTLP
ncbi:hypothetical protein JEQ12_004967 [Ovis aries]|uniref:HMG box domain-containing protein n=1 Tax=Ovis aries TaxID=9940 RepID=A0A836A1C7_SHEEP|nr:hypothetical protein JEQ12_004967 [Ovis aries]